MKSRQLMLWKEVTSCPTMVARDAPGESNDEIREYDAAKIVFVVED
jgi:hypothetical protein